MPKTLTPPPVTEAAAAPVRETVSSQPYVLPFVAFMVILGFSDYLTVLGVWEQPVRVMVLSVILFVFSRSVISFRLRSPLLTIGVGVAVFLIWIGPDVLFPGYREHWLFQNDLTGRLKSSMSPEMRANVVSLLFRSIRAAVLVPIIEELFWRAWLMRWVINTEFWRIPLGTYTFRSMAVVALLFASEHGPYWEVGLVAGVIYNWLMIRTKSLGDCILAHAITNACICVYAIKSQNWQYWM